MMPMIESVAMIGMDRIAASGNIGVQGDANDNVVIERNVIGTGAGAFALPATPGEGAGIYINQADSGTIQNNLIGSPPGSINSSAILADPATRSAASRTTRTSVR
jgi:hypothetical protein